jgi:hypothetical protein
MFSFLCLLGGRKHFAMRKMRNIAALAHRLEVYIRLVVKFIAAERRSC